MFSNVIRFSDNKKNHFSYHHWSFRLRMIEDIETYSSDHRQEASNQKFVSPFIFSDQSFLVHVSVSIVRKIQSTAMSSLCTQTMTLWVWLQSLSQKWMSGWIFSSTMCINLLVALKASLEKCMVSIVLMWLQCFKLC